MSEEVENTRQDSEQITGASPETQQSTSASPEKTFTQAELDRIVGERLARERAKVPSEDELKGYRDWKASQQTEAEKAAAREAELTRARTEAEALRRENAVIRAGVAAEDTDYVLFKVGKMEGDFSENLKKYLETEKRFTEPRTTTVQGTEHKASKPDSGEKLTDRERAVMGLPPLTPQ